MRVVSLFKHDKMYINVYILLIYDMNKYRYEQIHIKLLAFYIVLTFILLINMFFQFIHSFIISGMRAAVVETQICSKLTFIIFKRLLNIISLWSGPETGHE